MTGKSRGLVIPVILIALWEIGARAGILPPDTMSQPSLIAVAGWHALLDGSLLLATLQTFQCASKTHRATSGARAIE